MESVRNPVERLQKIAREAGLTVADVAAGVAEQQTLRLRFTAAIDSGAGLRESEFAECSGDRRYLTASITKPLVATVAAQLAAEGHFSLNEQVRYFVDGFSRGPLRTVTIRHLLTHSSGLPDMLPNNQQLREKHASLDDFVAEVTKLTPAFQPGTSVSYSSMGFAVLGAVLQRIVGAPIQVLMQQRLFEPLAMESTWLGLPEQDAERLMPAVVPSELPPWQPSSADWNWNSRYWRTLGAPWGGMISTAENLGRLAMTILRGGQSASGAQVLLPTMIDACTRNQTGYIHAPGETDRVPRPWGLGWQLNWLDHFNCLGDFLPRSAFGHWGATGTLMWIERRSGRWCVILTNCPWEISQPTILRMSNVVATMNPSPDTFSGIES